MFTPSNRGNGPAAQSSAKSYTGSKRTHTLLSQPRSRMLPILRLTDQPQCDAETDLIQQSSVLGISDSPNLRRARQFYPSKKLHAGTR
jgi:hypothetical protein